MNDSLPRPRPEAERRSRKRIILSCRLCRASKLKCDRKAPCTQCARRGLTAPECVYEPLPPKTRKSRSMAAKLDEIEGTIRGMMQRSSASESTEVTVNVRDAEQAVSARVVMDSSGRGKGTYVGATHFMTVLDDLEDLRQFFDESDSGEDDAMSTSADSDDHALERFLLSETNCRGRQDLLDLLPPLQVLNRLVMRYFTWHPPSSHIIHRPTFNRQYNEFCQDRTTANYELLALLFMILAEATLFSNYSAPGEIAADSPIPPMDRVRAYRSAGVWALSAADYTSPSLETMAPLLLNLEAEFVLSKSTPMKCYLLSSTCIRLMMRLGLHRDPSGLPNISVFAGEMRRRMWHFGLQIEMLVSFQMGLPSMSDGIMSDTKLPKNLADQDLSPDLVKLPPSRSNDEDGPLTYFIWKTTIGQVVRSIAKQTNVSSPMNYDEVSRLDASLEDAWRRVPTFLRVRPLDECITDEPLLVMERFSLGSIYHKGQCFLHRQYLSEHDPKHKHNHSRKTCLLAALSLLKFQRMHYEATRPGAMLAQFVWFLRPIIMGDFLLGAMIVYITLQSKSYPEGWREAQEQLFQKRELCQILQQSYKIWASLAAEDLSYRKAAGILDTMVKKARDHCGITSSEKQAVSHTPETRTSEPPPPYENGQTNGHDIPDDPMLNPQCTSEVAFQLSVENNQTSSMWLPSGDVSFDWQTLDAAMRLEDNHGTEVPTEWVPGSTQPELNLQHLTMDNNDFDLSDGPDFTMW